MNDDQFLRKHRKRPTKQFANALYQKIETKQKRKFFPMNTNSLRPVFTYGLATLLLAVALLTIPQVRAAVFQYIGTFNGVEVSIDPDANKFITSGNNGAVIKNDGNTVVIKGENQDLAVFSNAGIEQPTFLTGVQFQEQHPNLSIPTQLPEGYTLSDQVMVFADGGYLLTWNHPSGETITYGKLKVPDSAEFLLTNDEITQVLSGTIDASLPPVVEHSAENMFIEIPAPNGQGKAVLYSVPAEKGYQYQIIATDESLSENALKQLLP